MSNEQISHGLYVRAERGLRVRDQRTRRLARKMRIACSWLADSDMPAIRAWCELETLCARAFSVLTSVAIVNREGEPLRLLTDYRQLRACQTALSRELGLTPLARMQLKASADDGAFDLAAIAQEANGGGQGEASDAKSGLCAHPDGCRAPAWATGGPVPLCREHAEALAADGAAGAQDAARGGTRDVAGISEGEEEG